MAKHQSSQRFVFKITTSQLVDCDWNLNITFEQARENNQIISLASSETLRFIDSINGVDTSKREHEISSIKANIKALKKEQVFGKRLQRTNKSRIKLFYHQLNNLCFVKDYMCLIVDRKKDYKRAIKGFTINGVKYKRLLGTAGGLKSSTVVFVSENIYKPLVERLENGRDKSCRFIPSKYNAYLSLACSSSIPMSQPRGVAVVHDCITKFKDDYIQIKDVEESNEPILEVLYQQEVENNANDGFGLICPELAQRWSEELKLNYIFSGACLRNSFLKGMVYAFDFHAFSREIAHNDVITDVWGNQHNINDVELIITESMLKLWESYSSYENYQENCSKNGYSFSVTKVTPKKLDNVRNLNYQFIQSYDLSDSEIAELIKPTVSNIRDVLGGDINKIILFLSGLHINEKSISRFENDYIKALMIEPKMINDPFVQGKIKGMLNRKINDAKIGVVQVDGNFSLLSGDPFCLCQSMFGMEVTGLLKANQFYSRYWINKGVSQVVGFRAPMSCHNNIKKMDLVSNFDTDFWYKHMSEVTIFNAWDLTNARLNGCDYDKLLSVISEMV